MIRHCCDVCGKTIEKPILMSGYSNANLVYAGSAKTTYLELCDECLKSVEALLKLRKGLVDAD